MNPGKTAASSDAIRTSHAHASERPAPAHAPLIAAMTGFSSARIARMFGWYVSSSAPRTPPGGGDDDRTHVRIRGLVQCFVQGVVHRPVDRVVNVWPVERDRQDGAVTGSKDLVGHDLRLLAFPPVEDPANRVLCLFPEHGHREPVACMTDGLVPGEVAPHVELLLGVARRLRKLRRELLDPLVDAPVELCFRNGVVDEPPLGGLRCRYLVAEKDDLAGTPVPDHELEPLGRPSCRHRAVLQAHMTDEGRVDHDGEIARQLELVPAADRDPVDSRDRRLADLAEPVVGVLEGPEPLPVLARLAEQILVPGAKVRADAEGTARPRDDDGANLVVPRRVLTGSRDLPQHLEVECIEDISPVEPDRGLRRFLLVDDRLEAELCRIARVRVPGLGHQATSAKWTWNGIPIATASLPVSMNSAVRAATLKASRSGNSHSA